MDKQQLDPVAVMLSDAYMATLAYSSQFLGDYGQPPTLASKVHHMRSIAQANLTKDERYELGGDYAEFGRVLFTDLATDRVYLLRSHSAVSIENEKNQRELFDGTRYLASDVVLVVYRFHREGLDLFIAGTMHHARRTHLEASGTPTFIGTWPYSPGDNSPFDQQADNDPFRHLGDLDIDESESGT